MSDQPKPTSTALKKEHSYTYWVGEDNKSRELPEEHRPKKVSPPPLIESNTNAPGPSKWNSLGSWEERTVPTKELSESVECEIRDWLSSKQVALVLKEVSLEGEFKQIFSNNKRKVLYEVNGKVKFEGDQLELKLQELTCSGDREYQVKGKKKEEKVVLEGIASQIVEAIVQSFNRYKQ